MSWQQLSSRRKEDPSVGDEYRILKSSLRLLALRHAAFRPVMAFLEIWLKLGYT